MTQKRFSDAQKAPEDLFSGFYEGRVIHQRLSPKKHRLSYAVYSMLIDLDEIDKLADKLSIFSRNKFNILSFHDKDYGPSIDKGNVDKPNLSDHVKQLLLANAIDTIPKRISLLCYPRLWGFVFNPLAVYFCYDDRNQVFAIVYEVSNTFGERHSYVLPVSYDEGKRVRHGCEKVFYVSPFNDVEGRYDFVILPPQDQVQILINQSDNAGPLIKASFRMATC